MKISIELEKLPRCCARLAEYGLVFSVSSKYDEHNTIGPTVTLEVLTSQYHFDKAMARESVINYEDPND